MKSLKERIAEAVREEVALVPYDPAWPAAFEAEAERLRSLLPGLVRRVEHFGSTAIPGLTAKPIVDILVEVSSLDEVRERVVPVLESEGYEYFWRTDLHPGYAWFIRRGSDGQRRYHIHMVEADSALWERLLFRDYLREFPAVAGEYAALKRSLADRFPRDREAYTDGKAAFVTHVTRVAVQRYIAP